LSGNGVASSLLLSLNYAYFEDVSMKILLTGAKGMLGTDVAERLTDLGIDFLGIDKEELDITNETAVNSYITEYRPSVIIHCAAYTAVDLAETERELAYKINVDGTKNIAQAAADTNARLLYISTDYVFDGQNSEPYEVESLCKPINWYGYTKHKGEEAVAEYLSEYFIIRTSWLFGRNGNNFIKTMLKLAETRDEISVVCDQTGSPTFTVDLAVLLCDIAQSDKCGKYHVTNEGFCSWAELAQEIMNIRNRPCKVNFITTEQYPTKAQRPKNSRLSKRSLDENGFMRLPDWKDALERYLSR